jgi:UPF0716 family protein affecting phage T7 exclusion
MAESGSGNDRDLPATRALSIFIIPFLLVGFAVLFFWPGDTKRLFAWTINPRLMPMVLGSVYLGGAWFFLQAARATSWRTIKGGFVPVGTFASIMGMNTILHWDKFNHSHVAFWLWTGLYFTTPFLVFAAWLVNRRVPPGPVSSREISQPAAMAIAATGFLATAMGLFLFLAPERALDVWPWMLTPLTARGTGGIFCLGVAGLGILFDRSWQAVRIPLQVAIVMLLLILVSVARGQDDIITSRALSWILIPGFVAVLVGAAVLYRKMSSTTTA